MGAHDGESPAQRAPCGGQLQGTIVDEMLKARAAGATAEHERVIDLGRHSPRVVRAHMRPGRRGRGGFHWQQQCRRAAAGVTAADVVQLHPGLCTICTSSIITAYTAYTRTPASGVLILAYRYTAVLDVQVHPEGPSGLWYTIIRLYIPVRGY